MLRQTQRLWSGGHRAALSGATAAALGLTWSLTSSPAQAAAPPPALDPNAFTPFTLMAVERVSHDTAVYRFALNNNSVAGLPVASCLLVRAPLGPEGKPVVRPYTPISHPHERHLDLLVKSYPAGVMSKHFATLKVGDKLEMKGPMIKLAYTPNMKKHIGMVAGGTGITPMLQIIEEVLRNPADKTQLTLVYGSVSLEDTLLKPRLDALASKHAGQFKVVYIVDKAPKGWKGPIGFVTPALLKEHMPAPGDDSLVLVCGPPGMMVAISGSKAKDFSQGEVGGALKQLGYAEKHVFKM